MISENISIDEKAIYKNILTSLQDEYNLVYVGPDDAIPLETIQKCLDEKSYFPLIEKDFYGDSIFFNAKNIIEELLAKTELTEVQKILFRTTDEYCALNNAVRELDTSYPDIKALEQTDIHTYLRFHSNYDCWLPIWEQGGLQGQGTALAGIMAALSLNPWKVKQAAQKAGIETFGPWKNLTIRNDHELVDYDKFIKVLINTPNYGNWSFFGKVDGETLFDGNFDVEKLTIPAGTLCCMFNWWNGGGSLDFCETLRPVGVKELRRKLAPYHDDLKLVVDTKHKNDYGYTPYGVYGQWVSNDKMLI